MKNKSYIGISFIILLFGIYTVPKVVEYFSKPKMETFGTVPPFEFINQNGKTVNNETFKGKVYVVEFFFTTCPTICPIMNSKMVDIQNEFFGNPNFGIASISINPAYDTPEILKEYAEQYQVSSPNWHMLTGQPQEVVYSLANNGFKLYAGVAGEEVGGFEHSGLFALIDKDGNIRSRYDENGNAIMYYRAIKENEFGDQINELKQDIKLLLKE
ncbi:SCO family protein [Urechidicola croceus]|uniref:SCO family protein n=1 Tax=Urechidicola croceus TaxID=1850246 RepID=A0A1D8P8E3_9FLAO|nr:SCO family protein [Urechidicola croceus]AOW20846.1 SCO family protein [Urechidicola croceus]